MATPTSAYERKTPASSMPAAEMYPPIPSMAPTEQQHVGGAPLSPPPGSAHSVTGYGPWHTQPQQSVYPPVKSDPYVKQEGGGGGGGGGFPGAVGPWGYSQAEATRHGGQSAMGHGLPVTNAYYN